MKITYRHRFFASCPNNGKVIEYNLTIKTNKEIMVEHIVTACALHKGGFHEAIARELGARFGGEQTLTAHHHGVDIETEWSAE